jgi:predicted PurR-regulated permease PerM
MPSWLAAILTLACLWGVLVSFFAIFIPLIVSKMSAIASLDLSSVTAFLQTPIAWIEEFIQTHFASGASDISLTEILGKQITRIFNIDALDGILGSIASTVGGIFVAIFSVTFIAFFFLKDETLFLRILQSIMPTKYEGHVKHALSETSKLLSRYFIGIIIESMAVMLMVAIALIFCGYGVSNAFFIGLTIGVLNVIPYIGPWLGFAISMLISSTFVVDGDMTLSFIFFSLAGTVVCAQFIDNTFLQPLLYSNSVNAHPLEIFIVILMAGQFAGVMGMLLAIPTYTVLRVIAKEFFNNFKIVQRLTEKMDD